MGVTKMDYLEILKKQFQERISFMEKRPGVVQLFAPFYHEDGDMMDIFLEKQGDKIKISDYGMTIMRLSYYYELDTPNKEQIFYRIISENNLAEQNGNLFLETSPEFLYNSIFQFTHAIAKVSTMSYYRREIVKSLFYETLNEYIKKDLNLFSPQSSYIPDTKKDYLEVDYYFPTEHKPIFLFGVKDAQKARLTTIACLEFYRSKIPFKSVVVHEDFETLPKRERRILTNTVDKQFTNIEDFKESAVEYFKRETA